MSSPTFAVDNLRRTGQYVRTIDGDTFVMRVDLWAPTRVKPISKLEAAIRVNGWNAAELDESEGPRMRIEFETLLVKAERIDVYPTGMNRERIVCYVWLDGTLFSGLLHETLEKLRRAL